MKHEAYNYGINVAVTLVRYQLSRAIAQLMPILVCDTLDTKSTFSVKHLPLATMFESIQRSEICYKIHV